MIQRAWLRYPRHISGQIAIVVLTSIVLALALVVAIIVMTRREDDLENPYQSELDAFLGVVRLVDAMPNEHARSAILTAAAVAFPELRITTIPVIETLNERDSKDRYVLFLRQRLGAKFNITRIPAEEMDGNKFIIGITSHNGVALSAILPAFVPPAPSLTPIVSGTLVFVVASVSLLLLWATKELTAPLSQFADAAEQFGRDFDHRTLPEQGPEEIRKASRAFNRMGERLTRLMEDRTNMLAAISHDLRTPITRLRLRAEFVENEVLRAAILKDLEQLNDMVRSALAFIRDSRVESTATSFDLPALLRTICDQFAEMDEDVSYNGADHRLVRARPDAIYRAVTNLVENAVKFGTRAMIELKNMPDGSIAIDILDDGPGLVDADPEKLLRPFVRGDNARTPTPQSGFGLGLTIANSIIEAHGGQLTLCNRQPRGLIARLTLGSGCQVDT